MGSYAGGPSPAPRMRSRSSIAPRQAKPATRPPTTRPSRAQALTRCEVADRAIRVEQALAPGRRDTMPPVQPRCAPCDSSSCEPFSPCSASWRRSRSARWRRGCSSHRPPSASCAGSTSSVPTAAGSTACGRAREGRLSETGDALYRINQDGFRGPRHARPKPDGAMRVVVMGDSIAFGYAVDGGERVPARARGAARCARPAGGHRGREPRRRRLQRLERGGAAEGRRDQLPARSRARAVLHQRPQRSVRAFRRADAAPALGHPGRRLPEPSPSPRAAPRSVPDPGVVRRFQSCARWLAIAGSPRTQPNSTTRRSGPRSRRSRRWTGPSGAGSRPATSKWLRRPSAPARASPCWRSPTRRSSQAADPIPCRSGCSRSPGGTAGPSIDPLPAFRAAHAAGTVLFLDWWHPTACRPSHRSRGDAPGAGLQRRAGGEGSRRLPRTAVPGWMIALRARPVYEGSPAWRCSAIRSSRSTPFSRAACPSSSMPTAT